MRLNFRFFALAVAGLVALPVAASLAQRADPPPADPVRQVHRDCSTANTASERACYERALHERLSAGGAGAALDLLDRLAALDGDVRRDGHMYAHGIGIAALGSPDEVSRVFASCTPGWQSGCYHGVIQSYFLATRRAGAEIDTASLDALCGDYRGPSGDSRLLFQCTHGLGHGLTMFHGHDLRPALASCDLLSRQSDREACYGGAFMENIVNATQPHHVAAGGAHGAAADAHAGHAGHGTPAGHGANGHPGHGAGHAAAAGPWRALDPDDMHYPCSTVAEKYLDACYTIQTAAMLHHSGQDVRRAATECGRAPAGVRRTCFVSLGRDVSAIAATSFAEAVRLCGHAAAEFQPACNEGVVQSIINMNGDPGEGVPYCRAIGSAPSKSLCYDIVGRQALALPDGEARREQACRAAEEAFVDTCLGRTPAVAGATVTASLDAPRRGPSASR